MPRTYNCKKCHTVHQPPTGKQCQLAQATAHQEMEQDSILQLVEAMKDFKTELLNVSRRVAEIETEKAEQRREPEVEAEQEDSEVGEEASERSEIDEEATPDSLRRDMRLMARAAEKLSRITEEDSDSEDEGTVKRKRTKGRKSGSLRLASDRVRKDVDWPHLYIKRMVGGRRKPVAFSDLRVEEFALGFLAMLDAPECSFNRENMVEILKMVLQDTMDFSWANAVGFYEKVAHEVEDGMMTWEDMDKIKDMRVTYSRTVMPAKREQREGPKGNVRNGVGNNRCCALYQKRACEQMRDHHPFIHACSYCHRTCNAIFRHPEADCQRRTADEAKNVERRE